MLVAYVCLLDCSSMKLTGPHMETVHWRSQGGPVQFLDDGGRVVSSHGLTSSEHLTSRVIKPLWPHVAGHCTKKDNFSVMCYLYKLLLWIKIYLRSKPTKTDFPPNFSESCKHTSAKSDVKESRIVITLAFWIQKTLEETEENLRNHCSCFFFMY